MSPVEEAAWAAGLLRRLASPAALRLTEASGLYPVTYRTFTDMPCDLRNGARMSIELRGTSHRTIMRYLDGWIIWERGWTQSHLDRSPAVRLASHAARSESRG